MQQAQLLFLNVIISLSHKITLALFISMASLSQSSSKKNIIAKNKTPPTVQIKLLHILNG